MERWGAGVVLKQPEVWSLRPAEDLMARVGISIITVGTISASLEKKA